MKNNKEEFKFFSTTITCYNAEVNSDNIEYLRLILEGHIKLNYPNLREYVLRMENIKTEFFGEYTVTLSCNYRPSVKIFKRS